MTRRRRRPAPRFLSVSRSQIAGLGLVGVLGVLGGLNAGLDLAEKVARLARGRTPSGRPLSNDQHGGDGTR